MEISVGFDDGGVIGEDRAPPIEGLGEFVERGERPVGDGFVGERPEVFGRLEFRGVGRQEAELDAVGDAQPLADMPAGAVEEQDHRFVRAGADRIGEAIQNALEQRDIDAVGEPPFDRAGRRAHKAVEVEPLVFVRADRRRASAAPGPNPPRQRLQAEAVLVEGPQLDRPARRLGLGGIHRRGEVFLKASCASGAAALA